MTKLTWNQMVTLEPRLLALLEEAQEIKDLGGPSHCSNELLYTQFKGRLQSLVGWNATLTSLQTDQAWGVALHKLYQAMPPCRACGCKAYRIEQLRKSAQGAE